MQNKLKELRTMRKLKQKDIADYLNITVVAYSNYEVGKRQPSNDTIIKLADFFNVSTDYLLGVKQEIEKYPIQFEEDGSVVKLPLRVFGLEDDFIRDKYTIENTDFDVPLNWLQGKKEDYFLMQAIGNSMEGMRIFDGSILLFKSQKELESDEIGLFQLNGEELIKLLKIVNGNYLLLSTHIDHKDIIVSPSDDFKILGKLVREIIEF